MANSETLRALQDRLAERLLAVQSDSHEEAQWLAVRSSGQNYLIPLAQAGEIFSWQLPKRLPYTQPWFWGVANLRGSLVGVVDLAHFLGHPIARTEQNLQQARIITVHAGLEMNAGIVVDQLLGLRGARNGLRLASEASLPCTEKTLAYLDEGGISWQEIQLQSLVMSQEFLNVRL
jgi:twitching motility protein PilI